MLREIFSANTNGNKLSKKLIRQDFEELYNFFICQYEEDFRNCTTLFFQAYVNGNVNASFTSFEIVQLFYIFTAHTLYYQPMCTSSRSFEKYLCLFFNDASG